MIQTQKKIFRILTGFFMFFWLVIGGLSLLALVIDTGATYEANQIFDIRLTALISVVWAFVFYKMYTFKKIGMNLFVPMLIFTELYTGYYWMPEAIVDQVYWLDLFQYTLYFIDGILFALMYLTNMKKEFQ